MLSRSSILGLAVIGMFTLGCGKSNENASNHSAPPAMSTNAPAASGTSAEDARMVVSDFLDAFRKGDDAKAKRLLTKVAREKAEKSGLAVAQGSNDNGKIEVGEATFPTPEHDIAHVPTKWTDKDDANKPHTDRATWVCRLEPEGWRVAGFAAYVFEGEDPLLLSFEDPDDMAKKQKWLQEEIARRSKSQAPQHPSGDKSFQAEKTPRDAFRR